MSHGVATLVHLTESSKLAAEAQAVRPLEDRTAESAPPTSREATVPRRSFRA